MISILVPPRSTPILTNDTAIIIDDGELACRRRVV
jgi:hypothetical protein